MNEVKAYLRRVEWYDAVINSKLEEVQALKDMTTKITSTLGGEIVSGTRGQDKLGNAVAKIIDLEAEIDQAIDDYIDLKKSVCSLIERVTDTDRHKVLHKRYVEFKPWEDIAEDMNMSLRNVYLIHGRALQDFEQLMKGEDNAGR